MQPVYISHRMHGHTTQHAPTRIVWPPQQMLTSTDLRLCACQGGLC